jgi:hypothetical protein
MSITFIRRSGVRLRSATNLQPHTKRETKFLKPEIAARVRADLPVEFEVAPAAG